MATCPAPAEELENVVKLLPLRLIDTNVDRVGWFASQQGVSLSGEVLAIFHELESV